jgi:hypothetical protein
MGGLHNTKYGRICSFYFERILQYRYEETFAATNYFFFICISGGGAQTGSTRHVGHFWPIVPAPSDCEDGEFGGMKTGRGNLSTRRKPVPEPLCPPQIPLDQIRLCRKPATNRLRYGAAFAATVLRIVQCFWALRRLVYETHDHSKCSNM